MKFCPTGLWKSLKTNPDVVTVISLISASETTWGPLSYYASSVVVMKMAFNVVNAYFLHLHLLCQKHLNSTFLFESPSSTHKVVARLPFLDAAFLNFNLPEVGNSWHCDPHVVTQTSTVIDFHSTVIKYWYSDSIL